MDDLLEVLPRVFFLHDQDEATRRSFAELVMVRSYPKGNILFHHGDPCFAAYLIVSGRVKLTVAADDGREFALEVFGPADICGMIATLDAGSHNGTAITVANSPGRSRGMVVTATPPAFTIASQQANIVYPFGPRRSTRFPGWSPFSSTSRRAIRPEKESRSA